MRSRSTVVGSLILAGWMPAAVAAQAVVGTVVERVGRAPVSGAVVLLVNAADSAVSRSLTGAQGQFRLQAPGPGSYRVRTLRIGFRPATSAGVQLAGRQDVRRTIEVDLVPVQLDTVRVVDRNLCRERGGTAVASALWEQARTALLAAQITAGTRAIQARILTFDRTFEGASSRVREQSTRLATGFTTSAWFSLAADSLSKAGYVEYDAEGYVTYYAPDVDALLSSAFQGDHCFRLAANDRPGLRGLWFEPTSARGRTPEIKGTLWLDEATFDLRRLDYQYANVSPVQEDGGAGGFMEFVRMTNGGFAISHWSIRMPIIAQQPVSRTVMGMPSRLPDRLVGARVSGGELVSAVLAGDTLWAREPLVVSGTISDSTSGGRIEGATVSLLGTEVSSVTDARGRFTMSGLLPGEYTVEVRTASLDSVGATHQSAVTVLDAATALDVKVARGDEVMRTVCVGDRTPRDPWPGGVILGTARLRDDSLPPRNVEVLAEWPEIVIAQEGRATVVSRPLRLKGTRTDSRGTFRFCGLPANATVTLRVSSDSAEASPVDVRIEPGARFVRAEVVLDRLEGRGATFVGSVMLDSTQQPLAEVEVALTDLARSMLTNDLGRFRFTELPPGEHRVRVRRIGYGPLDTVLTFLPGRTLSRQIYLPKVVQLDTVNVKALRMTIAFEERRRLGLGAFLTRADIEKLEHASLGSILRQLPGMKIGGSLQSTYAQYVVTNRVQKADRVERADPHGFAFNCYAQVYVDNMLMYAGRDSTEPPFDIRSISPADVEAVEWYSSRLKVPPEFGSRSTVCGLLVIHTRRRQ